MLNKVSWKDTMKDVLNLGSDIRLPGRDMPTAVEKAEADRDAAYASLGVMVRVVCRDFGVEEDKLMKMVNLEVILDKFKDMNIDESQIPQLIEGCFSE